MGDGGDADGQAGAEGIKKPSGTCERRLLSKSGVKRIKGTPGRG